MNRNRMIYQLSAGIILGLFILATSCEKDMDFGPQSNEIPGPADTTKHIEGTDTTVDSSGTPFDNGVFIINEGNFTWNNGSLSFFDKSAEKMTNKIYEAKNGEVLGDVPQSMAIHNDFGYIVINNSQKIVVVDMESLEKTGAITGMQSPRYFLPVNDQKGYVTDLYADKIYVLDMASLQISGEIATGGWTEGLIATENKLFVTDMDNNYVWVVDTETDTVKDTIPVTDSPNSVVVDKNNKVWVLCSGGIDQEIPKLYKINATDLTIEKTYAFENAQESPGNLRINAEGDQLYFLNGGVFQMSITANNLPGSSLIPKGSKNFYSLGIDPDNENIYVSDAIDYTQKGKVYVYDETGTLVYALDTDINPGFFTFN